MIALSPLPDELDRAYLGRLMRMNGLRSELEIVNLMAQWANVPPPSRHGVCCLELLCRAAHMELTQFVCRHTTLPLRRSFTSYFPDLAHGSPEGQSMLRMTGMRFARPCAYLCVDCVKSDIATYGMSYWRRDHQLPGVVLCTKHLRPLRYVDNNDVFLEPPSRFVDNSHEVGEAWARLNQHHSGIQRFLAISRELLDRDKPIDVKTARFVLHERANERGWCTHASKSTKPLLSDQVLANFPRDWLSTIFPVLADKKPSITLNQMDGVLYLSTSASSVTPYILACCVLFESADEALNALTTPRSKTVAPRRRQAITPIDTGELRAAYIAAKGQYALILPEFSGSRRAIVNGLEAIGLPNLSGRDGQSLLAAATAFFVKKRSLADSAALGGIELDALEHIIRQGGAHLAAALTDISAPPTGPGTGVLRVKPKTPAEAGATITQTVEQSPCHRISELENST